VLHLRLGRFPRPWLFATLAVGTVLGGLVAGYEPVGGDPDRIYRPIKSELARALRQGRLPFWSDRFGLGVPLVAESHVAALYPPNLVLYRFLDVSTAYRWSMWLHDLALAAATYAYARRLGLTDWGAALAALSFSLCGVHAIQSSHEWFYHILPYLPLALLLAEGYLATGGLAWLAGLALALGAQWTLGHFQIQMWTGGLVMLMGLWRVAVDGRPWRRGLGLAAAVGWGGAIAAVQLALSWEFARAAGQTRRSFAELAYYSFPPAHWVELVLPRFFRGLREGPEAPYWHGQATTGFEAALYIGTIPLMLACVGVLDLGRGRGRGTMPWRLLVPLTFALATMPRWWPAGYAQVVQLPGLGWFRAPARYTLLTSLGLALLAGQGLDRLIGSRRFAAGLVLALALAATALAWGLTWSRRPDFRTLDGFAGLPFGVSPALVAWVAGLGTIAAWRSRRVGGWVPCLVAAIELGVLFHLGTTRWGWSVALPSASPILTELANQPGVVRVAGVLDDLPVRAGLTTASPYLGFSLPPPHPLLLAAQQRRDPPDPAATRWLRRFGVTHGVWDERVATGGGESLAIRDDPALDQLVYRPAGAPERRRWRVVRLADPFPDARVALHARLATSRQDLVAHLSRVDADDEAWFLPEDFPHDPAAPRARSARILRWDGRSAIVEHDATCDLVLTRAFAPGWRARDARGGEHRILRVDGGLQAVRLEGAGVTAVRLRYEPPALRAAAAVALGGTTSALLALAWSGVRRRSARGRA
jgi:hypothetical protein